MNLLYFVVRDIVLTVVYLGTAGDSWLVRGDVYWNSWSGRLHWCCWSIWSKGQSTWQRTLWRLLFLCCVIM